MFCIRQWECGVIFIYMCVKRRLRRVGIDIIWCYLHNDALKDNFLFHGIYKRHSYSYRCWLLSTVINGLQWKTMPNTEMNHTSRRFKDVSLLAMKKIGFCRCSISPILPAIKFWQSLFFYQLPAAWSYRGWKSVRCLSNLVLLLGHFTPQKRN